jgi:MFS family permease
MKLKAALICLTIVGIGLVINPEPAAASIGGSMLRHYFRHEYGWAAFFLVMLILSGIAKAKDTKEPPTE